MNKNAKIVLGMIVIVLIAWAVYTASHNKKTADNGTTSQAVAGSTYKVGAIVPLTGDGAAYGEPERNILQMAVDEINAAGNGSKLELVLEDGKCNGKDAANAMQKLVNVDKVQVVIGGFCSGESLAAEPIATQNKVALFSPSSSSPALTGISKFFVRNYPSDAFQGEVLAKIANDKGYKKVAMIQEQTDYAVGVNKSFTTKFQALGGTVTTEEFASTVTDFKSQLAKLKGGNPDALFIDTQTPAAAGRILKQLKDLGWKTQLFAADVIPGDPTLVSDNKDVLEGTITAEFGVDPTNAKFKHLLDSYKAKFGSEPAYQSYAQTEYDSVYIVKAAFDAVGNDGTKIANFLHSSVTNWQGAAGSVTIGSNGEVATGHRPEIIKAGKVEVYVK